jgi:hypothetical protein
MKRIFLLANTFVMAITISMAQWTGQTSSTDLVTPINRTGMISIDGYNSAQIRLNSGGTYYGKIGNPSPQVWSLGWGTSSTDINPVFSWNAAGNVGIGTTSPTSNLTIKGTGTIGAEILTDGTSSSRPVLSFQRGSGFWNIGMNMDVGNTDNFHFRYNGNTYPFTIQAATGNVGIGTTNPIYGRLHVTQSLDDSDHGIAIHNSTQARAMRLWTDPNNSYVYSGGTGQANLILNNTGNVGIGTTSPDAKLAVSGQVHAQEVKVSVSVPGPDYVFEKDYKLTSLEEIKDYIDQNKHLPEVPSAKEMEKNGIQLGEMNMLLLKKIEELTLHVIQLKRTTEIQQTEIEQLKNK